MLLIASVAIFTACDFLDIVPTEQATVDDLFATRADCEKFALYLYHNIPTHGSSTYLPDMYAGDDMITGPRGTTRYFRYKSILYGEETPSQTYFKMWSTAENEPAGNTKYDVYKSIRNCYMLLDRIDETPGLSDEDYRYWTGEAYFLIAYYHHELLEFYGPPVLVKKYLSLNVSEEEMYPPRSPYDECVQFIAENYDRAASLLPPRWNARNHGRATAAAALAYKARLYLHAASKQYNGNATDYSTFVNKDGTPLMPLQYDHSKWERARLAAQEAIEYAEGHGYRLYGDWPATDAKQGEKNYHDAFCATLWNENEVFFAGAAQSAPEQLQQWSAPRQTLPAVSTGFTNYAVCTFEAVEMYYTRNGLPLDVDPLTKDRYADGTLYKVASGDSTARLHRDREPRFYANVGFDRGEYEVNSQTQIMRLRGGELQGSTLNANDEYQSCTGYLNKKFISRNLTMDLSSRAISFVKMTYPYIRLAELYLSYAEADFEYNKQLSAQSLTYLNYVRQRSGLPKFEDSWAIVGGIPTDEEVLRKVLHQERSIEFLCEGRRYFDLRRWGEAIEVMNRKPKSWNLDGRTATLFYNVVDMVESGVRQYSLKTNWLAIPISQLNVNYNLVQNPGY
jgi:hypothetical protein